MKKLMVYGLAIASLSGLGWWVYHQQRSAGAPVEIAARAGGGAQAPAGARAWLMRPLDAARVLQELDLMSARARTLPEKAADQTRLTTLTGGPLPARRVLSAGGAPVPSEALGRRLGDALGAEPRPGRADRRS